MEQADPKLHHSPGWDSFRILSNSRSFLVGLVGKLNFRSSAATFSDTRSCSKRTSSSNLSFSADSKRAISSNLSSLADSKPEPFNFQVWCSVPTDVLTAQLQRWNSSEIPTGEGFLLVIPSRVWRCPTDGLLIPWRRVTCELLIFSPIACSNLRTKFQTLFNRMSRVILGKYWFCQNNDPYLYIHMPALQRDEILCAITRQPMLCLL